MNYKNAFKCKKCPQSNKEDGCPAWNEVIMTNVQSGEQKVEAGCFYQIMPSLLVESIKSSNVSAATHSDIKNEIARGYSVIAQSMPGFVKALAENLEEAEEPQLIEPGDKD